MDCIFSASQISEKHREFSTHLFADEKLIISDKEDNLQKAVYLLYNISEEYNLEIATKK